MNLLALHKEHASVCGLNWQEMRKNAFFVFITQRLCIEVQSNNFKSCNAPVNFIEVTGKYLPVARPLHLSVVCGMFGRYLALVAISVGSLLAGA